MNKVIIIGGNATGCKAAARLRRISRNYEVTIIEKTPVISFGSCGLPLYASGEIENIDTLSKTAYGIIRDQKFFKEVKGINVLINTEAVDVDPDAQEVYCYDIENNKTISLHYDALLFATGSKTAKPKFLVNIAERVSSFHSPKDAKLFKQLVQKGEIGNAVIIGGGYVGCELTESLTSLWGIDTTLIEKEANLLWNNFDPEISGILEHRLVKNDIKLRLSTGIHSIEAGPDNHPVLKLDNDEILNTDYVFNCLGVVPEVSLAEKIGIKIGATGGIVVDENMKASIPGIWAAGDCVETKSIAANKNHCMPLASLSNRMGRCAANSIAGMPETFGSVSDSISLKAFDLTLCAAGLNETQATENGYNTETVFGCWSDRPDYHPDSKNLFGKAVYEKGTLKLLGLQLAGDGEVTRYIDVFSQLLHSCADAYSLITAEHAYTPAHSSPLSPLNYIGYMILNSERRGIKCISPILLNSFNGVLIDVREEHERTKGGECEGSLNIPLSNFNENIPDLNHTEPLLVLCAKGARAFEAACTLTQVGFTDVSYLGGGFIFFKEIQHKNKQPVNEHH